MEKIEHIGIAVKDLESSVELFRKLLNRKPYKEEKVESEGVSTVFFEMGESKIELLGALNEQSPIAKFIEKRGEGIHHIAFSVKNIESEIERLISEGFQALGDVPKDGADNKRVFFFHPKSTQGVLVELCQEKDA